MDDWIPSADGAGLSQLPPFSSFLAFFLLPASAAYSPRSNLVSLSGRVEYGRILCPFMTEFFSPPALACTSLLHDGRISPHPISAPKPRVQSLYYYGTLLWKSLGSRPIFPAQSPPSCSYRDPSASYLRSGRVDATLNLYLPSSPSAFRASVF